MFKLRGMQRAVKLLISSTGVLFVLVSIFLYVSISRAIAAQSAMPPTPLPDASGKYDFPTDFTWGTATASYQIEGAATTHREPSIWDAFSETPGNVVNNDTGSEACDHYHRFESDIDDLIAPLKTQSYRFSIAWPRLRDASNRVDGLRFYNALVDKLVSRGIAPVATLYHWDLPLELQPLLSSAKEEDVRKLVSEFESYARTVYAAFGDRVKTWITLNEPFCSAFVAYEIGEHAPGLGTLGVDVYRVGHNLLLMHAAAVRVYREEFQMKQDGRIGITLNSQWFQAERPNDTECVRAARTALDFELGWFAHPVFHDSSDYPPSMRSAIGDRLPTFTDAEKQALNGSSDFFGLNHYSTSMIAGWDTETADAKARGDAQINYGADRGVKNGEGKGWPVSDMGWPIVPWGLTKLLQYVHQTYSPKEGIVITENGIAVDENLPDAQEFRINYYRRYIKAVHDALHASDNGIDDGMGLTSVKANVQGYFLWSLMDNFEWALGYTKRFGLYYVDYKTQKRTPKAAVKWYTEVVTNNSVVIE